MIVRAPIDLGLLIRSRRRELGIGQRQLAERIGVSRLWVIEFERGKPRAEIGLVLRALAALDLRLDASPDGAASPAASRVVAPPDLDAIVRSARRRR